MRKLNKKVVLSLVAASLMAGITGGTMIHAASVVPGGSFSASFSCGAYEGSVNVSGSNATITAGGNWCDRGGSVSASAIAGSVGTASISITAGDLVDTSSMTEVAPGTYLGGNSVTVVAPSNNFGGGGSAPNSTPEAPKDDDRSSNANLASLSVSQGELNPAFNADVTEYTVNLSATISKIKVDAKCADEKASLSGTGEFDLKAGENKITITVSAENGTTKSYVVNAKVDEKPLVYTKYNDKSLGIVRNTDNVTAPDSFEKGTIKISGKDVTSWTNKSMNLTLVYLVDEKTGEKNFYIYDMNSKTVKTVFKPTAILGRNVYIVDVEKELQNQDGLVYKKIKVDTIELMGWEYTDSALKNFALIYVMDESGKMQYYQYEKSQNTLQLHSGSAPVSAEEYKKLNDSLDSAKLMRNVFIGTTALFLITTVVGAYLWLKAKKD